MKSGLIGFKPRGRACASPTIVSDATLFREVTPLKFSVTKPLEITSASWTVESPWGTGTPLKATVTLKDFVTVRGGEFGAKPLSVAEQVTCQVPRGRLAPAKKEAP